MKYHDITPDELSELDTKIRFFDAGYTVPTAIERRDARIAELEAEVIRLQHKLQEKENT